MQKISGDREVLEVANRATAHLYIANPIKKFEKRSKGLFSTHPPMEERIKILRQMETGGVAETSRLDLDGDPIKRYNIRRCIAGWCNGSTSDSESLSPGSNPGPAAFWKPPPMT